MASHDSSARNIARAIIFVLRQKIHLPPHILARRIIRRDFARRYFNRLAAEAAGLGYREVLHIAKELEAMCPRKAGRGHRVMAA